jgi:hypothetical protein
MNSKAEHHKMSPTPTGGNNLAEQLQNSNFSWQQNKTEHHSRTNSSSLPYSRDAETEANSFWTFHRVQSLGSANETYAGFSPIMPLGHGEKGSQTSSGKGSHGQHLNNFSGKNNGKQVPSRQATDLQLIWQIRLFFILHRVQLHS